MRSAKETTSALRQRIHELTEENERLTEKVAARDGFLAFVAHELRNPMTPIVSRVAMLRRAVGRGDVEHDKLAHGLDQLEWLIGLFVKRATSLLDVSRITTGKLVLKRAEVDVCAVAHVVAGTFEPLAQYAGSPIALDLPAAGLGVLGDALAIEEILDNLVSNAIKYAGGKPIVISVAADPGIGVARICVKDGGPGISDDSRARIFERFERAVPSADQPTGHGVGLWIVRQLVEEMDGTIAVASTPGEGSTFCVTLPVTSTPMTSTKESHEHDGA
jgi:two-component system OmpR family sensor kinase